MDKDDIKKVNIKNRQDIVLTVILAIIAGFLVNIISGIFYDIFISKTISSLDISQFVPILIFSLIIVFESFLEFLIYDVSQGQNTEINKSFWKRFWSFLVHIHWANRASKSIGKIIWSVFKWLLIFSFAVSLVNTQSWYLLIILICSTIIYQGVKKGAFRKK